MIMEKGARFGQLVLLESMGTSQVTRKSYWLCECVCGTKKVIRLESLTKGHTVSCGCMGRKGKLVNGITITNSTLVRRVKECAKKAQIHPSKWIEEVLADWVFHHRSNRMNDDPSRHTERQDIDEYHLCGDVYSEIE